MKTYRKPQLTAFGNIDNLINGNGGPHLNTDFYSPVNVSVCDGGWAGGRPPLECGSLLVGETDCSVIKVDKYAYQYFVFGEGHTNNQGFCP